MAKKSKQFLQKKIIGYTTNLQGGKDLLVHVIIDGVGNRKVKEDTTGSRYVMIKNKRYHIKKSSRIYALDLYSKPVTSSKKIK